MQEVIAMTRWQQAELITTLHDIASDVSDGTDEKRTRAYERLHEVAKELEHDMQVAMVGVTVLFGSEREASQRAYEAAMHQAAFWPFVLREPLALADEVEE